MTAHWNRSLICTALAAGIAALAVVPLSVQASRAAQIAPLVADGAATAWKPIALPSPDALAPPPPPPAWSWQLQTEVWRASEARSQVTTDQVKAAQGWNKGAIPLPWNSFLRERLAASSQPADPVRDARAFAILNAAIYDALLLSQRAKATYGRLSPARVAPFLLGTVGDDDGNPSYPSSHAAAAWAAATAIAGILPAARDEAAGLAQSAADARISTGFAYPSDLAAGRDLGVAVAERVLAARRDDGAGDTAAKAQPAGTWRLWLPAKGPGGEFAALATTAPGPSTGDQATATGASAAASGSPPIAWAGEVAKAVDAHGLTDLHAARVFAYWAIAQADAAVLAAASQPHTASLPGLAANALTTDYLGEIFPADARQANAIAADHARGLPAAIVATAREIGRGVSQRYLRVYFFELERR